MGRGTDEGREAGTESLQCKLQLEGELQWERGRAQHADNNFGRRVAATPATAPRTHLCRKSLVLGLSTFLNQGGARCHEAGKIWRARQAGPPGDVIEAATHAVKQSDVARRARHAIAVEVAWAPRLTAFLAEEVFQNRHEGSEPYAPPNADQVVVVLVPANQVKAAAVVEGQRSARTQSMARRRDRTN